MAIFTYRKEKLYKHAHVMTDSTKAIAYINKKGGIKSIKCDKIAKDIWHWSYSNQLWISASHIPGVENYEAGALSRKFNDATEWKLNKNIFDKITKAFGIMPNIDLFASRLNKQLESYVSWKSEPEAHAIDAFTVNWSNQINFIFPPFSLLTKVVAKIQREKAKGIIIAPSWSTQVWYPQLMELANKQIMKIKPSPTNLLLPYKPNELHPLHKKLTLLAISFGPTT